MSVHYGGRGPGHVARNQGGSSPFAPLFLMGMESNSGGIAPNASASGDELAARVKTDILNNTSLLFEALDVGTNNLIDHSGITDNTTHSWEVGFANQADAGQWGEKLRIVKFGQGGSRSSEWISTSGGSNYDKFLTRSSTALSQIAALGKTAQPVLCISFGINDRLAGTTAANWLSDMSQVITRMQTALGMCPVVFSHLTPTNAAYDANIDILAANMLWASTFEATVPNADLIDANHWGYTGQKAMADAFAVRVQSSDIGVNAAYAANKLLYDGSTARAGTVWGTYGSTSCYLRGQQDAFLSTASFRAARGSTGKSSGKHYFEVWAYAAAGNGFFVGVSDATSNAASMNVYNPTNCAAVRDDGFAAAVGFTTVGSGGLGTISQGLTPVKFGVAVDVDAKKVWLSRDGSYLSSGDPAAGTNPYFTWSAGYSIFPFASLSEGGGFAKLVTTGFGTSPPSGFSGWD